jgi:ARG and Rhodanese-Phosphatase-superfamily-associated Protein domain
MTTWLPSSCKIGVIYRIAGVLAGLDFFGSETAFARAFPKLVRGSALQALAGFDKDDGAQADERQFLQAVLNATADRFPAVGLGEELRYDTQEIGGGALELDGGLVHLFAFPRRSNGGREEGRAAW